MMSACACYQNAPKNRNRANWQIQNKQAPEASLNPLAQFMLSQGWLNFTYWIRNFTGIPPHFSEKLEYTVVCWHSYNLSWLSQKHETRLTLKSRPTAIPRAADTEVELCPAPNGSYSLSDLFVKPTKTQDLTLSDLDHCTWQWISCICWLDESIICNSFCW